MEEKLSKFDQDLAEIQDLVDRDIPTVGLQRFFFHEIYGRETKMSAFIRALRNRDLDALTKEMHTWVSKRELALKEMLHERQRHVEEMEEKKIQAKRTIPSLEGLQELTVPKLRILLRGVSLSSQGRKAELIERLCTFRDS